MSSTTIIIIVVVAVIWAILFAGYRTKRVGTLIPIIER